MDFSFRPFDGLIIYLDCCCSFFWWKKIYSFCIFSSLMATEASDSLWCAHISDQLFLHEVVFKCFESAFCGEKPVFNFYSVHLHLRRVFTFQVPLCSVCNAEWSHSDWWRLNWSSTNVTHTHAHSFKLTIITWFSVRLFSFMRLVSFMTRYYFAHLSNHSSSIYGIKR